MGKRELVELLDGDEVKADSILKVTKDIYRYSYFKRAKELGIVYGKKDLSFTDLVLFSFIKEKIDG